MNKRITLFAGIVLVVAVILIAGYSFKLLTCQGPSHYVIESEMMMTPPLKYVEVDSGDLENYSLLYEIIDAFQNPGSYPGATVEGNSLEYEIFESAFEMRVTDTKHFLRDAHLAKYGPPLEPLLYFSYHDGGKQTYYSLSVSNIDYHC